MDAMTLGTLGARDRELGEDEKLVQASVRRFVRERYLPRAGELFEKEEFPRDLIPEIAELGLLGASLQGYGCAGHEPVAYGLVLRGARVRRQRPAQLRQRAGLARACTPIWAFGTEEQKQRFLPRDGAAASSSAASASPSRTAAPIPAR